jgi:hypothetical protein
VHNNNNKIDYNDYWASRWNLNRAEWRHLAFWTGPSRILRVHYSLFRVVDHRECQE